ncbi:MAG: TIGR03643 family protein [Verrucomicrobiota bacterium]
MTESERNRIIRMAWEDRTTFEEIEERTGLNEAAVIRVMRANLKGGSFRLWRKRVSGRVTKHRKLMEKRGIGKRGMVWDDH